MLLNIDRIMKIDIQKISVALFFFATVGICYGQSDSNGSQFAAPVQKSSNIEFSLFTGNVDYTIPIYTLDDPDFPLDIALHYHSDGFQPFQSSGCYGQNWSLSAGGTITRVVHGFPDEQFVEYKIPGVLRDAYVGPHYAYVDGWKPDKDSVYNMQSSVCDTNGVRFLWSDPNGSYWEKMDYLPDMFYFNFMGHQGRFILNNQGVPTIISGDYVNIDMSTLHERCFQNTYAYRGYVPSGDSLQISITTQDGYRYIFGGAAESLEYSVINDVIAQAVPAISTWHLSSIIAPNGRRLSFQYVKDSSSGLSYKLHYLAKEYDWTGTDSPYDTTGIINTLHKRSLLKSISTSDSVPLQIVFISSEEEHAMYPNAKPFPNASNNLQLDSISIKHGTRELSSARLNYTYRHYNPVYRAQTNCFWRYLSSVRICGRGIYTLDYALIDPYPGSAPAFYHLHPYPNIDVRSDSVYENMVDRFGFWKQSSIQGLLSEVLLPTGGKIRFTYNSHQYGEERRFQKVGSSDVELISCNTQNTTIGGARIEKIETFSSDNSLVETKMYSYNRPGTTHSSGVFYNIYKIYDSSNAESGKDILYPDNYGLIDNYIGYSHVQCITSIGSETYKTVYTFDTGHSSYSTVNDNTIHRYTDVSTYADSTELRSGSLTYNPQLMQTGKMLAVEHYQGNSLQKATYYRYNGILNTATDLPAYDGRSLGCTDTIVCLSVYSGLVARKLFIFPNVLEQSVSYEYPSNSSGQPMISSKSYTLDAKFRRKEIKSIDSRGITHFQRYTYPDDIAGTSSLDPYCMLTQSHRIGSPIEVISGYKDGETDYITSGTINTYITGSYVIAPSAINQSAHSRGGIPDSLTHHPVDSIGGLVNPDSVILAESGYYPYLYQTMNLVLDNPISDYAPLSRGNSGINHDSRYTLTCEYLFDYLNRPLSVKPFGKMATKYVWSGSSLYPSAKIIGNQTWTYTYIPYVGIGSITDPRGITTYYSYDYAGRLIEEYQIVNGKKQILNFYYQHIKTE